MTASRMFGKQDHLPWVHFPALGRKQIRQQRRSLAWNITWCHRSPKGPQQPLWSLGSGEFPAPSDTPVRSCINYSDHVWPVCNSDKPQNCRAHNACIFQTCGLLLQCDMKTCKGRCSEAKVLVQGHTWAANCHIEVGNILEGEGSFQTKLGENLGMSPSWAVEIPPQTPATHLSKVS